MLDFYRRLHRTISPSSRDDDSEVRTDGGVVSAALARRPGAGPDRDLTTRLKATLDQRFGSDFIESSVFWLPPFLLMGLFVYGAIIWNLLISLTDYQRFENAPDYSNLDFEMYTRALADTGFIDAAINTLILLIAFTAGTLVVGLVLAILIDRGIRFENTFRTIYLLPMSLVRGDRPVLAVDLQLQQRDRQQRHRHCRSRPSELARQPGHRPLRGHLRVDVAVLGVRDGRYLAGLRAIPTEHYEAATVDGASTLKMYWRVIIPS